MKEARVIIFSTVWPEPDSSAAGVRQMQWVRWFRSMGYEVILISPSKIKNEKDWGNLSLPDGVRTIPLPLNREWTQEELEKINPAIVMFDRFILEEQFGPQVYRACPDALVLMETQDLHLVRRAREEIKEKYLQMKEIPPAFYQTETALREIGSILRVDFSFVVSSFEEQLLRESFGIPQTKVKWLPFFYEEPVVTRELRGSFASKKDFCWVGNFRHAPNVDGLRWFRNEVWPILKSQLPEARLRIFGAYPPQEVMEWNSAKNGIEVKGSARELSEVFAPSRVNLAPLRFGAGVKGKILEGFRHGVPCVSTRVGVEGLFGQFPGFEANTPQDFANACVKLHEDEKEWKKFSLMAIEKMSEVCAEKIRAPEIRTLLEELLEKKKSGTVPDWTSRVLRFEGNQSRHYFSKWIEEKEKSQKPT